MNEFGAQCADDDSVGPTTTFSMSEEIRPSGTKEGVISRDEEEEESQVEVDETEPQLRLRDCQ